MKIDLRQGFGDFNDYSLFKFPDNSIKFVNKLETPVLKVITTLRSNDDLMALLLVSDVLERTNISKPSLYITYMMYQQDDRLFARNESFGLKVVSRLLNNLFFSKIKIFHPHSDKVEFIDNVSIISNTDFVSNAISNIGNDAIWVIPDSGAFKTQFKQIEKSGHKRFITCMKSRDHVSNGITTVVNSEDLNGADCFIVDDICLGGRTFLNIAIELKKKNCGKLCLIVSHGVFNSGIESLLNEFTEIYTTDSICSEKDIRLNIFKILQ